MAKELKKLRTRNDEQEELYRQVCMYRAWQKMRVSVSNQVSAIQRRELVTGDEADEFRREWVKPLKRQEDRIVREAAKALKGMPIWESWLSKVHGIGPVLGVQLVALIQPIADFPNVAKLWSYAGYAVADDGRAVRHVAGQQSRWNPELKLLGFQAGDCFIKLGGAYRELYDRYKARDKARHPEQQPLLDDKDKAKLGRNGQAIMLYTDMHLHNRARRYAVKIFLSHLWQVWRELQGLPVPGPYPVEVLGHTTVLSPWAFIQTGESQPVTESQKRSASQTEAENQDDGASQRTCEAHFGSAATPLTPAISVGA